MATAVVGQPFCCGQCTLRTFKQVPEAVRARSSTISSDAAAQNTPQHAPESMGEMDLDWEEEDEVFASNEGSEEVSKFTHSAYVRRIPYAICLVSSSSCLSPSPNTYSCTSKPSPPQGSISDQGDDFLPGAIPSREDGIIAADEETSYARKNTR